MSNERKDYTQNFPLVNKDVKILDFNEALDALQIAKGERGAPYLVHSNMNRIRNIEYRHWRVGTSGSQFSFSANGTNAENTIVNGAGPFGATIPLWKCYNSDAASDADGGWNATVPMMGYTAPYYRYSVWIKCEGDQNGTTYFGCGGEAIQTLSGVADTNPYFWYGDLPAMGQWYLLVGHIQGYGKSYGKNTESGIYNTAGTKVAETLNDYRFSAQPRCHIHRCYLYYTTSAATIQYMAYPRIDVITGTGVGYPSLASLINGAWVADEATTENNWLISTSDMSTLRNFAGGIVRYGSSTYGFPTWIDPNLSNAIRIRACHLEQVRQVVDDGRNNARCASGCISSCGQGCSSACYTLCTTTCGGNCYYSCGSGCSSSCGAACQVDCSSGCWVGCFSNCSTCVNWCGCYGSCKGSCDSRCGGGCTSSCGGACSGGCAGVCAGQTCTASCAVNCSAGCDSACSKDCSTGCAGSCYNTCNASCYSGCANSARVGTEPGLL